MREMGCFVQAKLRSDCLVPVTSFMMSSCRNILLLLLLLLTATANTTTTTTVTTFAIFGGAGNADGSDIFGS